MSVEADVLPPVIPRRLPGLPAREQDWPAQGEWTYEDYSRLPDDGRRYEIIDGVLYATAAPNVDHQYAVGEIFAALRTHVREHQSGIVICAPFEVHLPDVARPVQPDVLFVDADRAPRPGAADFTGAPDLIVEVYALSEDGTYDMAGQYTPGETVTSTVLSDLALPVDDLFVR